MSKILLTLAAAFMPVLASVSWVRCKSSRYGDRDDRHHIATTSPNCRHSGDAVQLAVTGIAFVHVRAPTAILVLRCTGRMAPTAASLIGLAIPTAAGAQATTESCSGVALKGKTSTLKSSMPQFEILPHLPIRREQRYWDHRPEASQAPARPQSACSL